MIASGGMPSSHSSTVTALAVAIRFQEGFADSVFAITMILACVVMYDAVGVRLHAGKQAEVLNQIVYELPSEHQLAEARPSRELLGHTPCQWKSLFSPEGRIRDGGAKLLKKVRCGGIDPSIRVEVWPFLLAVYDLSSSEAERNIIKVQKSKEYEDIRRLCQLLVTHNNEGGNSLGFPEFNEIHRHSLDQNYDLDQPIYDVTPKSKSGHMEEDSRSTIMNIDFPLIYTDSSSESESSSEAEEPYMSTTNEVKRNVTTSYHTIEDFATWQRIIRLDAVRANTEWTFYSRPQALQISEEEAAELALSVGLKDFNHLDPCMIHHASRLVTILEAYAVYDPEIGYCQGMSDLLSPILAIVEEDYEAFWCFVGFMKKARHNFRLDEIGISRQLKLVSKIIQSKDSYLYRHLEKLEAEDCFFVYRMVVVLFRRELSFEQTACLWEVMWADQAAVREGVRIRPRAPPTEDLLLYAIAACVLRRRKLILESGDSFDEIMRECNGLAGQLDVWELLDDAHHLVVALHDKINLS